MDAGRVLREARRRAGLSQRDLSQRAGTTQSAISAYESGAKDPTSSTLVRLLAATGTRLRAEPFEPDSVREYLAARGAGARSREGWTLAATLDRIDRGEDVWVAVREFLDVVAYRTEVGADVGALLADRPPDVADPRVNALAGALAEHVAVTRGVDRPRWATEPVRFLDRWWFPHRPAFDALAVGSSPAAFRRRGIFVDASTLDRC